MTKTTHRYDESFTISAAANADSVREALTEAVTRIEDSGADIDWANLEINSERHAQFGRTFIRGIEHLVSEYTTVTLTARGRK